MKSKNVSLAQNAVLNGIKQTCSIIFPLLSFAYCSRVIGKVSLGIYSFSQSVVSYFILIAALGIPNYAIREGAIIRNDELKLKKFIDQVFTINCFSMILSFILLAITVFIIPKFHKYSLVMAVLSAQLFLNTIGVDWVNSIIEDYLYLTIRYIIFQIVAFVCLLIFVHSESDIIVYTLITMLSNVGGNILNVLYLKKQKLYPRLTRDINLKKHILPIVILFANSVAGIVYLSSDITMLGFFLTEADVGVYTVSSKIYTLVKTVINAVIMVTIPRFSNYIGENKWEEYKSKLDDVVSVLFLLLVPCVIGIITEAKTILELIAGPGYAEGIVVVRLLGGALPFAVFACFFSYSILIPNKKEKEFMIATIIAALSNIILNLFMIPIFGILGAAITTLIAECIVVGMSLYYSRSIILPSINGQSIISVITGGLLVLIVCLGLDLFNLPQIILFIVKVILSAILYIASLFVLKNKQILYLFNKIIHKHIKK